MVKVVVLDGLTISFLYILLYEAHEILGHLDHVGTHFLQFGPREYGRE